MEWLKTYRIGLLAGLISVLLYGSFGYDLYRADFIKLFTLIAGLFFFAYLLIERLAAPFWLLAGIGIVSRLVFLPAIPNLSQDFYRFLWDGRLLLQGINPNLVTPETYLQAGNEVVPQALALYEGMGELNGSHYSNYPPVNQLCFVIAALLSGKSILGSAIVLRIIIILADIGILYYGKKLLESLNLPVKNIFWYFINPFIIIELTGNLHFEAVMLFFLVAGLYYLHRGRWWWAGILIGLSVSVKLIPLLLLPLFFRWFVKKKSIVSGMKKLSGFYLLTLATIAVSFLPFLSSEFVSNFAATIGLWFQNFEFNASVYYIIRWIGFQTIGWNIIADVGKILPLVVLGAILLLSFFRRNDSTQQMITALVFGISIYFMLSTTVHPWYVATPLVLCIFTRYRFPVLWSGLVMLSYIAYTAAGFSENLWLVALEYVGVLVFLVYELWKKPSYNKSGLHLQHAE